MLADLRQALEKERDAVVRGALVKASASWYECGVAAGKYQALTFAIETMERLQGDRNDAEDREEL